MDTDVPAVKESNDGMAQQIEDMIPNCRAGSVMFKRRTSVSVKAQCKAMIVCGQEPRSLDSGREVSIITLSC